jgi:hypothetical protein
MKNVPLKQIVPTSIASLVIAIFSVAPTLTWANGGGSGSHGGGFVACRDATGKLQSLELADLYEGRTKHGFTYQRLDASPRRTFRQFSPIRPKFLGGPADFQARFHELQDWIITKIHSVGSKDDPIREAESVERTRDVHEELLNSIALPSGCEFLQSASYRDSPDELLIVYNDLAELNLELMESVPDPRAYRLAILLGELMSHEILYRIARERAGDFYSTRIRYILAFALSDQARSREGRKLLEKLVSDLWQGRPFAMPAASSATLQKSER